MPRVRVHAAFMTLQASRVLAFFVGAWVLLGCTVSTPVTASANVPVDAGGSSAFAPHPLPGAGGATLVALQRPERAVPARLRVIVVPGSGCAGMGRVADRYFAGLLHAQVLVLHKPGVDPYADTAPADCSPAWVQRDRLTTWRADAVAALRADAHQRQGQPALPQVLVGISEGGELLAALAPEVPKLAGLVLLSASGLDPQEAGALQASRLGVGPDWQALERLQGSALDDGWLAQGRSLGYWRDLWHWPLAQNLINSPWPLLQVWGEADELVPPQAYEHFRQRALGRRAPYCSHRFPGADHGLQRDGEDGVQRVWAWLEQWARWPTQGWCSGQE